MKISIGNQFSLRMHASPKTCWTVLPTRRGSAWVCPELGIGRAGPPVRRNFFLDPTWLNGCSPPRLVQWLKSIQYPREKKKDFGAKSQTGPYIVFSKGVPNYFFFDKVRRLVLFFKKGALTSFPPTFFPFQKDVSTCFCFSRMCVGLPFFSERCADFFGFFKKFCQLAFFPERCAHYMCVAHHMRHLCVTHVNVTCVCVTNINETYVRHTIFEV